MHGAYLPRAPLDVTRVPSRVITVPAAWRDAEDVVAAPHSPSHVLLWSTHHISLLDAATGHVYAQPPHPHRHLTAGCLLAGPAVGSDGSRVALDGAVVATGDRQGVLCVTRGRSKEATCQVTVLGQGDVWSTVTGGMAVENIIPCDGDAHRVVCQRRRERNPNVWLADVESGQAWALPLAGPVTTATATGRAGESNDSVQLFNLSYRCGTGGSTTFTVGSANDRCATVHHASTLATVAALPFPSTSGSISSLPSHTWAVENFISTAAEHHYAVVLRERGRSEREGAHRRRWLAAYDTRRPDAPYLWAAIEDGAAVGTTSPTNASLSSCTVKVEREEEDEEKEGGTAPAAHCTLSTHVGDGQAQRTRKERPYRPTILAPFGSGDGAACVLVTADSPTAASRSVPPSLLTWRRTPNGVCAQYALAFPRNTTSLLAGVRAMTFTDDGILSLIRIA